jgi:hypothetical protein
MVKAAKQIPSLRHYIWSTLPNTAALSNGKYSVLLMDTKSKVDDYIQQDKEFLAKTTFVYLTIYASNLFFPVFTSIHVVTLLFSCGISNDFSAESTLEDSIS